MADQLSFRGLEGDAITRVSRPLPWRDEKPRGFLRLIALDFWIAYGARVSFRSGFWERAWRPWYVRPARERRLDRSTGWPMPKQRRFVRIAMPGGEVVRLASWDTSGRLNEKARPAVRNAREEYLRRGVLADARRRLREETGEYELRDGDTAAIVAEVLGPESMGFCAIAATARAGIFDDIHDEARR